MYPLPKDILDSLEALDKSYNRRDPARIEERHEHIQRISDFLADPIFREKLDFEDAINTLCDENAMVTFIRVLEDDYYFREYARVPQVQVCYTYVYISHYTFPSPCRVK